MAVVDLKKRITYDWDEYSNNIKSHESNIYISQNNAKIQADTSLNLTIGEEGYDNKKRAAFKIPERGIRVKPGKYVVLITEQYVGIPYNIYGLVVGKGANIFLGGVISTGKIIPGYKGELKIGYYNASNGTIVLKRGDLIACCVFFDLESTLVSDGRADVDEKYPALEYEGKIARLKIVLAENWYNILSVILSVAAILATIFRG